jgi:hypothetical protein
MDKMIIAGQAKDLIASVHNKNNGKQVATGTMFAIIRLESADADDGKYWDGSNWIVTLSSAPTATHLEAGQWLYTLPPIATSGKGDSAIHYTFTDDLDESSASTVSGGGEHFVREEVPVISTDVSVYESEPLP